MCFPCLHIICQATCCCAICVEISHNSKVHKLTNLDHLAAIYYGLVNLYKALMCPRVYIIISKPGTHVGIFCLSLHFLSFGP